MSFGSSRPETAQGRGRSSSPPSEASPPFHLQRQADILKLRQHVGMGEWEKRQDVDEKEAEAFGGRKVLQLERYDAELAEMEEDNALVDAGEMAKVAFSRKHRDVLVGYWVDVDKTVPK